MVGFWFASQQIAHRINCSAHNCFGYTSRYVSFEADMMKMNYMKDDLRKAEAEFNRLNAFSSSLYIWCRSGKTLTIRPCQTMSRY